jgi:hypothetical protein
MGGEQLHLAKAIGTGYEGQNRGKKTAAEQFYLFAKHHFLEEHEKLGMPRLEPMEDGPGIMQYGGDGGKAIEDRKKGPPADLVCLFERRFLYSLGQEVIGADYDITSLHSTIILRMTRASIY